MLSILSKIMLSFFGYKIDKSIPDFIKSKKQKVLIFPHTSLFDGFLGCCICAIYPNTFCFGVTTKFFNRFKYLLKYFGGFEIKWITNRDGKGTNAGGTVDQISYYLKINKSKSLVLNPEGDIEAHEWHSGFYYIAKNINVPISIIGADYVNHVIKIIDLDFIPNNSYDDDVNVIKDAFSKSKLYPLFPEKSNPKIPTELKTSYFNYYKVCGIMGFILFLKYFLLKK